MLKVQYRVKSDFAVSPVTTEFEESAFSAGDLVLVQENVILRGFGSAKQAVLNLNSVIIYQGFGSPTIQESEYVAETALTEAAQVAAILRNFITEKARLQIELPAIVEAYQVEKAAKQLADTEARRIADEQKAIAYAAKLEAASNIEWNAEGKAILNLFNRLETLSKVEMDSRFNNWIKRVEKINKAAENGYCFEGAWVKDKTVEISNENAVFIVAGTSGSRKHATTNYRVVILSGGKLQATDIMADNSDAGWALLIRDRVAALLAE